MRTHSYMRTHSCCVCACSCSCYMRTHSRMWRAHTQPRAHTQLQATKVHMHIQIQAIKHAHVHTVIQATHPRYSHSLHIHTLLHATSCFINADSEQLLLVICKQGASERNSRSCFVLWWSGLLCTCTGHT